MPKYSVCMTCFNESRTVRDSLNSLLGQLGEDYEVVVVDNFSMDGTYEVLRDFEQAHKVKVIRRRCSRGLGRQIALRNASGEYIIANLDLDDIFLPVLEKVLTRYHEVAEGSLMAVFNFAAAPNDQWVQNITIGPRDLISSLGGWRDLNVFEDWDIWNRADRDQKYCWTSFRFASNEPLHPELRNAFTRLTRRYERYRERLRLGMRIFSDGERVGLSQRLAFAGARLSLLRRGTLKGQDPSFNPLDPRLFVDFVSGKRTTNAHF
jgi:glycosyltransferase involved in cell wall biosynthesis